MKGRMGGWFKEKTFPMNIFNQVIQKIMQMQSDHILKVDVYNVNSKQILGKGSTGHVYKGYHRHTQEPVAVKVIQLNQINNEVTKYLLEAQKKALATIHSPYVVEGVKVKEEGNNCYMIMEEYNGGTLKDYIRRQGKIRQTKAIQLFHKILIGYISIVENLFIHRDLKTSNIMLKNNSHPVIIDFGYCQMIIAKRPTIRYNVGSPSYMSPESYLKSQYSEKSDIWSLGIILYEMLTGKTPDDKKEAKTYFQEFEKKKSVNIDLNQFSPLVKEILEVALVYQPQKRATVHKLKYIIDKSMIPMMKLELKKTQSDNTASKYIPPKVNFAISKKTIEKQDKMGNETQRKQLQKTKQTILKHQSEMSIRSKPVTIKSIQSPKTQIKTQLLLDSPKLKVYPSQLKHNLPFKNVKKSEKTAKKSQVERVTFSNYNYASIKSIPSIPSIPSLTKHISLPQQHYQSSELFTSLKFI